MTKLFLGMFALAGLLAVSPALRAETPPPDATEAGAMARPHSTMKRLSAMTPEEREKMKAERKARFDALPPEKQAELKRRHEENKARHAEMREKMEKIKNMTPEQRAQLKAEQQKKFDSLPAEQQARMMQKHEEREARRAAMHEKMKNMTPEQREQMRAKWKSRHSGGPAGEPPAAASPAAPPAQ